MTIIQKQQITRLRNMGKSYAVIAKELGRSANTVKSYCRRNGIQTSVQQMETCPECGLPLRHLPHKKQKRFCSDGCRLSWWAKHPEVMNRTAIYHFVCPICGDNFTAYGNAKRKYCSRACFGQSRRASHA